MHRFFCSDADFKKKSLTISDRYETHHLRHVLRLKKDDKIVIFNGSSQEATCKITKISNNVIETTIESVKNIKRQKRSQLILACAIPKRSKFELIIEKCTELGVDEIIPIITKRTEVSFDEEKAKKKNLRYQNVAINASKQSKRTTIPKIHPATSFDEALNNISKNYAAFIPCLIGERKRLDQVLKPISSQKKIIFFIGPEGDFTDQEIAQALDRGCIPVTLGNNILKVDTAAISVISLANLIL